MSLLNRIRSVPLYKTTEQKGGKTYTTYTFIGDEVSKEDIEEQGGVRILPKQDSLGSGGGDTPPEIAPEVFHLGVINEFLGGASWSEFPTDSWENKPKLLTRWRDAANGVDSSELNDDDFIWLIQNYEAIKEPWEAEPIPRFSYVLAAISNYFNDKQWALTTGDCRIKWSRGR